MQKKVIFRGRLLPVALLLPQLAITVVFFFWPAGRAIYQSLLREDAFGLSSEFVGLENFQDVLSDPNWLNAALNSLVFSGCVAGLALGLALFLAVQADKSLRGVTVYRSLLIWPYAVAPAVAAVLWLFLFQPQVGLIGRHVERDDAANLARDLADRGAQLLFVLGVVELLGARLREPARDRERCERQEAGSDRRFGRSGRQQVSATGDQRQDQRSDQFREPADHLDNAAAEACEPYREQLSPIGRGV